MVKARGRQAEKLPGEKKIGCITVSFIPVKASIEDQLQRLSDALMNSLTKAIQSQAAEVEAFLDSSLAKLKYVYSLVFLLINY